MEFIEIDLPSGEHGTEFTCWETFAGVLAPVVKATYGNTLVERFGDYQRDVKACLESQSSFQSPSSIPPTSKPEPENQVNGST